MWIRSQDKETLIETKYIRLFCNEKNYVIYAAEHISPNEKTLLGTYSTKEKALEVLDRIQNAILIDFIVFQMPLDNEVINMKKENR